MDFQEGAGNGAFSHRGPPFIPFFFCFYFNVKQIEFPCNFFTLFALFKKKSEKAKPIYL